MAEPPAAAPSGVAASQQDALLATKLHLPRPPAGFVPRPRLVAGLDHGLARGLVLVCAPAGFGKTALLADWARRGRWPVAWLSLDQGDNDPARFWRHVVAALDRARPGLAERVAPLLGPPAPASFEGLVTALVNQLAAQPDQVLLVLDDYHLVDAQPVHASVGFLLEHLPAGLRLLLASRVDPPLPPRRCRWQGCGPAGSWPSCAPPTCASPPRRRRRCCAERSGPTCRRGPWARWRPAPKAGRRGCSWRRCRCAAGSTWTGSW